MYKSLLILDKLFAPIIPFITEEVYQNHFKKNEKVESIHLSSWPVAEKENDFELFNLFLETLSKIRQEKSSKQKPMNSEIVLSLDKETKEKLKDLLEDLANVTNAGEIKESKIFSVEFKN